MWFDHVGYVLLLVALAALSTPRRVGDGLEYAAVALNLAAGRPPSLGPDDKNAIAPSLAEWRDAPPVTALNWPELVGRDGRQDVPHAWVYPAVVAPALWITDALGVHANHAFTLVNVLSLLLAWHAVRRTASLATTALICSSPIVWWVDKAHSEAFVFGLLAAALSLAREGRLLALLPAGLCAAQNPALLAAHALAVGELGRAKPFRGWSARWWLATASSLFPVASVMAYNWSRHGTVSPLALWTSPHLPSLGEWLAPLLDLNIGVVASAPMLCLGLAMVVALGANAKRGDVPWTSLALLTVSATAILTAASQSTNVNHGATPSMSRYGLWLIPLVLPLLLWADRGLHLDQHSPRARRRRAVAAWGCALSAGVAVAAFRPSLPEVYRYPTAAASAAWARWPSVVNPAPEIFAERLSHREPAVLPVATPGCEKVLLYEGTWPVPCLPSGEEPPSCRAPGRLCYANRADGDAQATFVSLGAATFPFDVAEPRWSARDPFLPALARLLEEHDATRLERVTPSAAGSMVRAIDGAAWSWALQRDDRVIVVVGQPREGASLTLRTPSGMTGALTDLSADRVERTLQAPAEAGRAWRVDLPPTTSVLALTLRLDSSAGSSTR